MGLGTLMGVPDSLKGTSVFDAVSLLLAIVGITLSVTFYLRSRVTKEVRWAIRSTPLLGSWQPELRGLEVRFNGEPITNLSVSMVAFWSNSSQTIVSQDIPHNCPIELVARNGIRLLDAQVVSSNGIGNDFGITVSSDQQRARLSFEFMGKSQGAVFRLIHTGSASGDISLDGVLAGSSKNIKKKKRATTTADGATTLGVFLGLLFWPVIIAGFWVAAVSFAPVVALILPAALVIVFVYLFTRYWLGMIPPGLGSFFSVD